MTEAQFWTGFIVGFLLALAYFLGRQDGYWQRADEELRRRVAQEGEAS